MAGKPQGGIAQADAELFRDRPWILCPGVAEEQRLIEFESLLVDIGACPVRLGADEHDRAVAITSHVPQLLASALLAQAVSEGAALAARGPGFQSATRVAGGPEAVWQDIFASNGDEVARQLRQLAMKLDRIAQALGETPVDAREALEVLAEARRARDGR
jgi:prephenate dehydrogenase